MGSLKLGRFLAALSGGGRSHRFGKKNVLSNDWFADEDGEIRKLPRDKKLNN